MRVRAAAVATVLVALAPGGASSATGAKLHGNNFFSNCASAASRRTTRDACFHDRPCDPALPGA